MATVLLSDLPGEEPGTGLKAYQQATQDLYWRCPSDQAYEDIMNGLAHLDKDGQVVYEESDYFE